VRNSKDTLEKTSTHKHSSLFSKKKRFIISTLGEKQKPVSDLSELLAVKNQSKCNRTFTGVFTLAVIATF
jgi:hypothetical protein